MTAHQVQNEARHCPALVDLVYRGLERSDAIEASVAVQVQRLSVVADLVACRVIIEAPPIRHRHGASFHVRMELALADRRMTISHAASERGDGHADVYSAIHDAFHCARRTIDESRRREREEPRRN